MCHVRNHMLHMLHWGEAMVVKTLKWNITIVYFYMCSTFIYQWKIEYMQSFNKLEKFNKCNIFIQTLQTTSTHYLFPLDVCGGGGGCRVFERGGANSEILEKIHMKRSSLSSMRGGGVHKDRILFAWLPPPPTVSTSCVGGGGWLHSLLSWFPSQNWRCPVFNTDPFVYH